jgi:opacity protein-like surface antigen
MDWSEFPMGTIRNGLLVGIVVFLTAPGFAQLPNQGYRAVHSRGSQNVNAQPYQQMTYHGGQATQPAARQQPTVPPDPHFAIQAQQARQRLAEERAIAMERYAMMQDQYQMPFPKHLPQRYTAPSYSRTRDSRIPPQISAMYRRQQSDPFGESQVQNAISSRQKQQDPFGEDQPPIQNPQEPAQRPTQQPESPPAPVEQPSSEPQLPPAGQPAPENQFQPPTQDPQPIDRTVDPFPNPPTPDRGSNQTPARQPDERSVPQQNENSQDPFGEQQIPPQQPPADIPAQPNSGQRETPPTGTDQQPPGRDDITSPENGLIRPPKMDYPPGAVRPGESQPPQNGLATPNQTPSGQTMPPQIPGGPSLSAPSQNQYPTPAYPTPAYPTPAYPNQTLPPSNQPQPNFAAPPAAYPQTAPYDSYPQHGPAEMTPVYQGVVGSEGPVTAHCGYDRPLIDDCYCPMFYLSVFGGGTSLRDLNSEYDLTVLADEGGGVGVALGQIHGCNLRSELEFAFRSNGIAGLDPAISYLGNSELDGHLNSYAGMANFYWEFMRCPTRCIKPYVGGGIGFVSMDAQLKTATGLSVLPDRSINDSSLAYQMMAGLNYKASCCLDIFVEYRYFKADSFQVDSIPNWGGGAFDYETSNVFAGARFKF